MLYKETDSFMRKTPGSVEKKTEMKRIMAVSQGITQGVKHQAMPPIGSYEPRHTCDVFFLRGRRLKFVKFGD